jgi:aryl-alcohol dehydrogenase-like predicted oxidoreductase
MAGIKRHHLPVNMRGTLSQDFAPDYLTRSVEGSLKRLRTDYLDLFQLHSPPAQVLERAEFLGAIDKLKAQGKIRYFGVSCERAEDAALCLPYVDALQLEISVLATGAVSSMLPAAAERGVAVIARECFGGGLLTKPVDALGLEHIIPDEARRAAVHERIVAHHAEAADRGMSSRQLALRFVLEPPAVSVALLGMRTQEHLASNLQLLTPTPELAHATER